jgi:hypothetical protein
MTALIFKIINNSWPECESAVKLDEGILRKLLRLAFLPEKLEAEKNHMQISGFKGGEIISTPVIIATDKFVSLINALMVYAIIIVG